MANDSINIEQLQNEIDKAESYLNQVTHTRVSDWNRPNGAGGALRVSIVDPDDGFRETSFASTVSVNSSHTSTSSSNRYADPVEREKLLQRLLAEHGAKSRNQSASSSPDTNTTSRRNEYPDNPSHLAYGDDSYTHQRRDEDMHDTLFFASDILGQTSGGIYSHSKTPTRSRTFQMSPAHYPTARSTMSQDSIKLANYSQNSPYQEYSGTKALRTRRPGRSVSPDMSGGGHTSEKGRHVAAPRRAMSRDARTLKSTLTDSDDNAHNKIGNNGKKYLKSKDEIMEQAKREFQQRHPFKPRVTAKAHQNGQARQSTDRIDAMLRAHEQNLANREQQRIISQKTEVESHCTFRPQISKRTQQILQQKKEDEASGVARDTGSYIRIEKPLPDRLHAYAEKKELERRKLHQEFEEARRHEYTYQPSINPATNAIIQSMDKEYRPIYERVGELQREEAMNKQILLACYEEAQNELTFQPEINDKSRKLAVKRLDRMKGDDEGEYGQSDCDMSSAHERISGYDVGSRLMQEAREQLQRKFNLIEEREREVSEQFKNPKPCKGSDEILRKKGESALDFATRQKLYDEKTKKNIASSRQREEIECSTWFKPEISDKSTAILHERRPELVEETQEQRVHRLHREDMENMDTNRQKIENEVYGGLSFVPEIDPISRALGRTSTINELVENKRGRRVKEQAKQIVEQKQSSECSFRPQIKASQDSYAKLQRASGKKRLDAQFTVPMAWCDTACPLDSHDPTYDNDCVVIRPPGSINMKEPDKMARDIRMAQMEREERRQAQLIVQEVDELKECTFQPQINRENKSKSNQPVVVRGIGRHFELKNLLRQQKELAAKRQEEAFKVKNVDAYRRKADGRTVVQPFNLTSHTSRKSRAVIEMELQAEANLTFSPKTNEAKRRSMIRNLVDDVELGQYYGNYDEKNTY